MANAFSTAFEEAYATLRRLQDSKLDKNRVPTLQERMQMSHDIFKLDGVEMAGLLTMIERSSPTALSRRSAHDEVLVNIDAISCTCFHECNTFILNCLLSRAGSQGKRGGKRKNEPGKEKEKAKKGRVGLSSNR